MHLSLLMLDPEAFNRGHPQSIDHCDLIPVALPTKGLYWPIEAATHPRDRARPHSSTSDVSGIHPLMAK